MVGHNCYSYDNVVLLSHLVGQYGHDDRVMVDTMFTDISGWPRERSLKYDAKGSDTGPHLPQHL